MPKTILIADNHAELLEVRTEFLEDAGFTVLNATSPETARHIMAAQWLHLAILDIRLQDDQDPYDISGLQLAADPAFQHIPKIMLTNYPDFEYVRRALLPPGAGLPPAVDFLAKKEGPAAMLDAVNAALAKYSRINWELQIHVSARWPANAPNLHNLLYEHVADEHAANYRDEATDLLRKLFCYDTQITLDRLLWRRPGRLGLTVHAYNINGQEQQHFVTCGLRSAMEQERRSALQLENAGSLPGAMRCGGAADTLRFSANCYEIPGQTVDALQQFPDYWRANPTRDCGAVVERLATNSLPYWHQPQHLADADATWHELYAPRLNLPVDAAGELQSRLVRLGEETARSAIASVRITPEELLIRTPRGREFRCLSPFGPLLSELRRSAGGAVCGPTLGELHLPTILIDNTRVPWLTDFGAVAAGPVLGDYAVLEMALKIDLPDETPSIDDLFALERELLHVARLSQRVDPDVPQADKLVAAITRLRTAAADALGDAATPYLIALYCCAVKRLLSYQPNLRNTKRDLLAQLHACVCLGLLGDWLSRDGNASVPSSGAPKGLQLDEVNHEVRVDGRLIELSPQQYNAFVFLWKNSGRLCTREDLSLAVYGPETLPADKDALAMLLSRLRAKIEPDPDNPKYLVTRRGSGMVLYRGE